MPGLQHPEDGLWGVGASHGWTLGGDGGRKPRGFAGWRYRTSAEEVPLAGHGRRYSLVWSLLGCARSLAAKAGLGRRRQPSRGPRLLARNRLQRRPRNDRQNPGSRSGASSAPLASRQVPPRPGDRSILRNHDYQRFLALLMYRGTVGECCGRPEGGSGISKALLAQEPAGFPDDTMRY